MKKILLMLTVGSLIGGFLSPTIVSASQITENITTKANSDIEISNEDGTITTIDYINENKVIVVENGQESEVTRDIEGNVYIDGDKVITLEEESTSNDLTSELSTPKIVTMAAVNYNWQSNGYRKYSTDFTNKTRQTAAVALALIPGWGVYAAATAEVAIIWTTGKKLWFRQDNQISKNGVWSRSRTRTYRKSNYTSQSKDSGWSGPVRIHW